MKKLFNLKMLVALAILSTSLMSCAGDSSAKNYTNDADSANALSRRKGFRLCKLGVKETYLRCVNDAHGDATAMEGCFDIAVNGLAVCTIIWSITESDLDLIDSEEMEVELPQDTSPVLE